MGDLSFVAVNRPSMAETLTINQGQFHLPYFVVIFRRGTVLSALRQNRRPASSSGLSLELRAKGAKALIAKTWLLQLLYLTELSSHEFSRRVSSCWPFTSYTFSGSTMSAPREPRTVSAWSETCGFSGGNLRIFLDRVSGAGITRGVLDRSRTDCGGGIFFVHCHL